MAVQIITGLKENEGARYALICGDPERVPRIASRLSSVKKVRHVREFNIMSGKLLGERVLVASTGIGGPSTAILMEELANTGTDTFIRVGTSGGIAEGLRKGDLVITTAAYRRDGTSRSYVPDTFPAAAHHEIIGALMHEAEERKCTFQKGVTLSVDGFYSENRILNDDRVISMSRGGFMLSHTAGNLDDAKKMGVKNIEMEMGTVLTLTTLWNIRGGGICLVSDVAPWHETEDIIDPESGMDSCVDTAVGALIRVIGADRERGN
ncbi:MAG: nucleoside phosphorylase [Thermoplasmata archaeon]|nr:nucleoside phosphorylase [Candidatus Sysuiplasma acidicola]MBX8646031.1 nucleoside phosphorylase [Candidatus Sysuiplasma acidicola]